MSKKNIHYGTKGSRKVVSSRTSTSARPWNHPEVVAASSAYGVPFASFKQVHIYENTIQDNGSLEDGERYTCRDCGRFKTDPKHEEHMTDGN
jgi:hypothetical protein